MKDVFYSSKSDLSEIWKQNELLKDQLLEATLKREIECCVLLNHECVENNIQDEIQKVQRDSIEIQEGMQKRINILENDVQRCQKQSLNFELQLQHEREKHKCESSLKTFVKPLGYRNWEINELIAHVTQKTHDYAAVRAENQDLLMTISELKAKLKNVENGKSVNTKFDKAKTLPNKQQVVGTNKNVIAPRMYKVGMSQVANTSKAKSVLSSTELSATSSVRIPSNKDSSFKNSVTSNTKNSSEKVEVSGRRNKTQDVVPKNVALNTIVTNDEIKNALIAKNVLCVTCAKNVLILCHDNCFAKYKLNVRSKVRRSLFTTPRTVTSMFKDTTAVVSMNRFFVRTVQSKTIDTILVVSKAKIDTATPLSDKHKASKAFTVQNNSLSNYMKNKIQTSRMWKKWYKLQPNVGWSPVKKSPHVNNGQSTVKPSVSDKKWLVKLSTCPCVVSSCVAGGSNCFVDC
ncbi:hypothetical protein Tco_0883674 [Tanacetum coccineum]